MSSRAQSTVVQPSGVGEDSLTHHLRLFTRFLQVVFATWDKASYRWSDDESTTDIIIQGEGVISPTVCEKRPAIIVSRSPTAWTNISLDQFAGPLLKRDPKTGQTTFVPNMDPETGAVRHTDLLASTIIFNVLSSEGMEAVRLAGFCAYAVRTLKTSLMRAGVHRVGEDIQIGSVSPPGALVQPEGTEIFMVPVTVPFFYQQTYTISPKDKLLLTEVNTALSSEIGYPAPGGVPIKEPSPPGINGRVIGYTSVLTLNQAMTAGPYKPPRPRRI